MGVQLELFPKATEIEIAQAKQALVSYQLFTRTMKEMEMRGLARLPAQQLSLYRHCRQQVQNLDSAVRVILDNDVRSIVQYRYIEGHSYTETTQEFAKQWDDRTIDRKLNRGIAAVADALMWLRD